MFTLGWMFTLEDRAGGAGGTTSIPVSAGG